MLLLPLPIPSLHLTLWPCISAVHRAAAPSPARGRYSHTRLHQALNPGLSVASDLMLCFGALSSSAVILPGSPAWQQGSLGCPGQSTALPPCPAPCSARCCPREGLGAVPRPHTDGSCRRGHFPESLGRRSGNRAGRNTTRSSFTGGAVRATHG